ncbi:MAG: DEAD/DEAH box helicase family protein [Chloroflexota bacterium]|nr:DEAD/DEAH box helicase family protein [Chloroflexota bacterium]
MATATIDRLIINSPYVEPSKQWKYDPATRLFDLTDGRRPAGFIRASVASKTFDDPGIFVPLELPNQIRPRVVAWRDAGYAGVTGMTKRLLAHWYDLEQRQDTRFFFCQLEAIETLIWLTEAPVSERQGIEIPSDGGAFQRVCSKMATGSGKTIVMAMLIAWQVLNKVAYPQDRRFSKNVFVVAPGLTVRERLQVLLPGRPGNFYDAFNVVPPGLDDKLRQGRVLVRNWHALSPIDPDAGPKVVRKGPESDETFTQRVLAELAGAKNLIVINDEAHHAWRVPPKVSAKDVGGKDVVDEATVWVGGLDRIHKVRSILHCFDFSATPFAPTGKQSDAETLFDWIVSDFGLNDAIESGLVKTPRVVVRDDGKFGTDYKSRLYHIYNDSEVKADLSGPREPQVPLPMLVNNAILLLGTDWLAKSKEWRAVGRPTPPVLIVVCNRTETAARVAYAFTHKKVLIEELQAAEKTLHIDSKVLEKAEAREEATTAVKGPSAAPSDEGGDEPPSPPTTKKDQAEWLREVVNTIGQPGKPGAPIQTVISVGMLTEGWDARTVTHILGLRAFESQLLCEQVVGRGLRRTDYQVDAASGLFQPEYVNVFGVPFTFLPHEGDVTTVAKVEVPTVPVYPDPQKREFEMSWPNVVRIDREYRGQLTLDLAKVKPLALSASDVAQRADLAQFLAGKPDFGKMTSIHLQELAQRFRMQKLIFEAAVSVYEQMQPTWSGAKEDLLRQLIGMVERVLRSDRITVTPAILSQDDVRRRLVVTLSLQKVVQHIWEAISFENVEDLTPVFDTERPIRSTGDMTTWYTRKPRERTRRSHINVCVFDSSWEATEAMHLDESPLVSAWVKNDHLGFEFTYVFNGVLKKFRPDFLVKLTNGVMLILEVKGQDTQDNRTKREFLSEWVRAINSHGGFGRWVADVSFSPDDLADILSKHEPEQRAAASIPAAS